MIEIHTAEDSDRTRITIVIEHNRDDSEPRWSFSVSFSEAEERMLTEKEAQLVREAMETPQMQVLTEELWPRYPMGQKAN